MKSARGDTMKKTILLFVLIAGCSPYMIQNSAFLNKSCASECIFRSSEFQSIDSECANKGLYIKDAEAVMNGYSNGIVSFFNQNQHAFNNGNALMLNFLYQSHDKIKCIEMERVKDSILTDSILHDLNASVFKDMAMFDVTSEWCISIDGRIAKNDTGMEFKIQSANYTTGRMHGRTKTDIMKSILRILPSMRYAYNKSLRVEPRIRGRLTIKFIVNQNGDVVFAEIMESTLGYCKLEKKVFEIIRSTKFEKMSVERDLTTVIYPFIFAQ